MHTHACGPRVHQGKLACTCTHKHTHTHTHTHMHTCARAYMRPAMVMHAHACARPPASPASPAKPRTHSALSPCSVMCFCPNPRRTSTEMCSAPCTPGFASVGHASVPEPMQRRTAFCAGTSMSKWVRACMRACVYVGVSGEGLLLPGAWRDARRRGQVAHDVAPHPWGGEGVLDARER